MARAKISEYQNKEAVREVLGSIILQPKLIKEHKILKEDFVEPFHKIIYASVYNLTKGGALVVDEVSIDGYLKNYETQYALFNKNSGLEYIEKITEGCEPNNISYYSDQLKKFSLLRRYVEKGIDVSDYFNPKEIDPDTMERQRKKLDGDSIQDIVNFFKAKVLEASAPFVFNGDRDSKKAGVGGHEQKEKWKKYSAWGIGYASAYLTTALHGIRKRRFTVKSAGTGFGKTRSSIGDLCYSCAPKYYDRRTESWCNNPNGAFNGGLYIGTEMELLEEIDPILWAYMADVPQEHIIYNLYEEGEEERVDEAIRILEEEGNIWEEYVPNYDSDMLEDIIATHKINHNIEYVWFDYIHSTTELNAEYAEQSKVRMNVREDMVLSNLSNKLKAMTRRYDISLETCTQVSGDFKNEENRDSTIVRGAKAIIDKADGALIGMPPTQKELKKIEDYIRKGIDMPVPNVCYSLYKNRGGRWNNIKIWLYVDYDTMRVHDLFVTDYQYKLIEEIPKTYINVTEEGKAEATEKKTVMPIKEKEKQEDYDF